MQWPLRLWPDCVTFEVKKRNHKKTSSHFRRKTHLSLQSQSTSYWKPFWTLQYQTMIPSRSCSITPSARVLMSSAEADPLLPTKMLVRGTFTWIVDCGRETKRKMSYSGSETERKMSYRDGETFPLWCSLSKIVHIIQRLERSFSKHYTCIPFNITPAPS